MFSLNITTQLGTCLCLVLMFYFINKLTTQNGPKLLTWLALVLTLTILYNWTGACRDHQHSWSLYTTRVEGKCQILDMLSPSVYFTVSLPAAKEEVVMSLGEGL